MGVGGGGGGAELEELSFFGLVGQKSLKNWRAGTDGWSVLAASRIREEDTWWDTEETCAFSYSEVQCL